jgi:hypothetical protein
MSEQMTYKLEVQVLKSPVWLFKRVHKSMPNGSRKIPLYSTFLDEDLQKNTLKPLGGTNYQGPRRELQVITVSQ